MATSAYDFNGGSYGDPVGSPLTASPNPGAVGGLHLDGAGGGVPWPYNYYYENEDPLVVGADCEASIRYVSGHGNSSIVAIFLRMVGGDGYSVLFNMITGQCAFEKQTGYSGSSIRAAGTIAVTYTDGCLLTAKMSGTVLSAYKDGVLIGSADSDSTYTAAGMCRIGAAGFGTTLTIDDWSCGDLGGNISISIDAGSISTAGQTVNVTSTDTAFDAGAVTIAGQDCDATIHIQATIGIIDATGQSINVGTDGNVNIDIDVIGNLSIVGQDFVFSLSFEIGGGDASILGQSITVAGNLAPPGSADVLTTEIQVGYKNIGYMVQLSAAGDAPITWSLAAGTLPAGLSLSSSGIISGMPTTVGESTFTVRASNAIGNDTQELALAIGLITQANLGASIGSWRRDY